MLRFVEANPPASQWGGFFYASWLGIAVSDWEISARAANGVFRLQ